LALVRKIVLQFF